MRAGRPPVALMSRSSYEPDRSTRWVSSESNAIAGFSSEPVEERFEVARLRDRHHPRVLVDEEDAFRSWLPAPVDAAATRPTSSAGSARRIRNRVDRRLVVKPCPLLRRINGADS